MQVPAAGPYTGGFTSRISKISQNGTRTTVVGGLPSSQTNPMLGGLTSGVADVQFIDGKLYGMEAGAGCSHGLAGTDNTIFRVNADGTTTTVADLSAFVKAHPVVNPSLDDFEPDGTWYSMVEVQDVLYATEPNHQEVDRITRHGKISRVVDLSTLFVPPANWQGPTSMVYHNGNFYFGVLGTFPVRPGTQNIYKMTPSGHIKVVASGLTAVLGVAFDRQGRLYALESITVPGFPGPQALGSGRVVRVNADGTLSTIATGLTFPTAMTFDPDGDALYVSNNGFLPVPGAGQIVRINVD
jgi:sugar lactone lactonase YvrE